jgi:hypothetical protein
MEEKSESAEKKPEANESEANQAAAAEQIAAADAISPASEPPAGELSATAEPQTAAEMQLRAALLAASATAAVGEKEYPGSVADTPMIYYPDGRVELRDEGTISQSSLYNHDLAPVPVARRTWSTYNYAALWISMSACIPTYQLSSGLP